MGSKAFNGKVHVFSQNVKDMSSINVKALLFIVARHIEHLAQAIFSVWSINKCIMKIYIYARLSELQLGLQFVKSLTTENN